MKVCTRCYRSRAYKSFNNNGSICRICEMKLSGKSKHPSARARLFVSIAVMVDYIEEMSDDGKRVYYAPEKKHMCERDILINRLEVLKSHSSMSGKKYDRYLKLR